MNIFDKIILLLFILTFSIIIWYNYSYEFYDSTDKGYIDALAKLIYTNDGSSDSDGQTEQKMSLKLIENKPTYLDKCPNKSLNYEHQSGILPPQTNQVCSQLIYSLDEKNSPYLNPESFYKNIYRKTRANFDDGRFKGYNYTNMYPLDNPRNVGRISLEKTNIFPVGTNY